MKKIFLIYCLLSLSNLFAQVTEKNSSRYSIISLIANPKINDGKWISIAGFLKIEEGLTGIIYLTRDDMKYNNSKNALILHFDEKQFRDKNLNYFNSHYVRIIGYFNSMKDYYYSGNVDRISHIDSMDDAIVIQQYKDIELRNEKRQ